MKIKAFLTRLPLLLLVLLAGCSAGEAQPEEKGNKLTVYASIYPLLDFTEKVGGDRVDVRLLVPPGGEPHDWEPAASDIIALEKADLLICNGAGLESWTDTVLPTLENEKLIYVETGAELFARTVGDFGDPHFWLSPKLAREQMCAIKDALVQADPGGEAEYTGNFSDWDAEFERLDNEFSAALSDLPRRDIVVAHAAFGHLCRDYALTQIPAQGFAPDSEPDPASVAKIIGYARENGVKVIFFEEQASPGVAEAIAREIGAQTDVLNPLESLAEERIMAGDDYFAVMRRNLEALVRALS